MTCMTRSTTGIIIGILNILVYVLAFIGCIKYPVKISKSDLYYCEYTECDIDTRVLILLLFVCSIMILLSALLVVGIVKKRHTYMAPWIVLTIIAIVYGCIRVVIFMITSIADKVWLIVYVLLFLLFVLGLGMRLVHPICLLYIDIHKKNNEIPGETITVSTDKTITHIKNSTVHIHSNENTN